MTGRPGDLLSRQLAGLPPAVPDAIHSASVRARCHAALARQHRRHEARGNTSAARRGSFELALAGSLSLLYLAVVIRSAMAIYGF